MKWMAVAIIIFVPHVVSAATAQFVFTTEAQSVPVDTSTEQITLEAHDAAGAPTSGSTLCIRLTSSHSGSFSTNTSWSDPVSTLTLTLSSNQSRRNFYYRGAVEGTHTLTAEAAPRPDDSTCSQWSPASGVSWRATHDVTVGTATDSGTTNPTDETEEENTETASASTTTESAVSATKYAPVSSYVPPPVPQLFADAGVDRTVIVGAHTEFEARAYDRHQQIVENASFRWNFGDGSTAVGASVLHHFSYPGRYVVTVSVAEHYDSASDRIIVTAEPARLEFFWMADGSIVIENHAGKDINVSKWVVRAFLRDFVLPEDSIILSGASMRIAPSVLGFFAGAEAELAYPNGALAYKAAFPRTPDQTIAPATTSAHVTQVRTAARASAPSVPRAVDLPISDAGTSAAATSSVQSETYVAAAAAGPVASAYWWLGALVLAGATGAGVIASRRLRSGEWDIEEG